MKEPVPRVFCCCFHSAFGAVVVAMLVLLMLFGRCLRSFAVLHAFCAKPVVPSFLSLLLLFISALKPLLLLFFLFHTRTKKELHSLHSLQCRRYADSADALVTQARNESVSHPKKKTLASLAFLAALCGEGGKPHSCGCALRLCNWALCTLLPLLHTHTDSLLLLHLHTLTLTG
jgi:hypothetical protein